jgi:6-phosphofructokinase 1
MEKKKRLGILTGGGDCPGLNAAIRATAKTATGTGYEVIGIRNAWQGFISNETWILNSSRTSEIIDKGGTILATSRVNPFQIENGVQQVFDRFEELGLESLVVLGGEGSLSLTHDMYKKGLPVIGIPKTIDNDVEETDFTIGFHTAVQIATDALDRLRSTAQSHHRVMLLEVMGRHVGWIAAYAGIASGADAVLVPEIPMNEERIEQLCHMLKERNKRGKRFSIVVVAEGINLESNDILEEGLDPSTQKFIATEKGKVNMLCGVGNVLGGLIVEKTGLETRVSSLDYIQRGGAPVAYDRNLATFLGVKATELAAEKKYGMMATLKENKITSVPLSKVAGKTRKLDPEVYKVAEAFFG